MNKTFLFYPPSQHIIRSGFPLPVLSAYLKQFGYPVKVLDCPGLEIGISGLIQAIKDYDPEIIGLSIPATVMRIDGLTALRAVRKEFPEKLIVTGGIHVTVSPEEAAPLSDIVCMGYGHETLREIAELYPDPRIYSIRGIGHMKNGEFICTAWREGDFKKIPIPDWDSIPYEKYNDHIMTGDPSSRCFAVMSSMGCAYNCSFCASWKMSKNKLMFRDVQDVINEIEYMQKKTGFKYMKFIDPNFTINHEHVRNICSEIIRRRIQIKWGMSTTVKNQTKEIASIMKQAGLARIGFSYESCNEKILQTVGKKITKKEMYDASKLYYDIGGIMVDTGFIIGFPDDTIETVWETLTYTTETPVHNLYISLMCPFPGTEIEKVARQKGRFAEKLLYDASPFEVCYIPPGLEGYDMNRMKTFSFYYFYSSTRERLQAWLERFKNMPEYTAVESEWINLFNHRDELTIDYFRDYCKASNKKSRVFYEPHMPDFSKFHEKSAMIKKA